MQRSSSYGQEGSLIKSYLQFSGEPGNLEKTPFEPPGLRFLHCVANSWCPGQLNVPSCVNNLINSSVSYPFLGTSSSSPAALLGVFGLDCKMTKRWNVLFQVILHMSHMSHTSLGFDLSTISELFTRRVDLVPHWFFLAALLLPPFRSIFGFAHELSVFNWRPIHCQMGGGKGIQMDACITCIRIPPQKVEFSHCVVAKGVWKQYYHTGPNGCIVYDSIYKLI